MTLAAILASIPPWVLLAFGLVAGGLKSAWSKVYDHTVGYVITKITLSLTVEDLQHRHAYAWLSLWVERCLKDRKVNSLVLRQMDVDYDSLYPSSGQSQSSRDFRLIPNYGTYYMRHKQGYPMLITHSMEAPQGNSKRLHTLNIHIWFTRNRQILLDILREAKEEFESMQAQTILHYRVRSGEWYSERPLASRPLTSIFLPANLLTDILTDIQTFLDHKTTYLDLSIPYRRGYQLEGPPGSGKSSLILALACHFRVPVYSLSLHRVTSVELLNLLAECTKPAFVVLEDVDCLKAASVRQSDDHDGLTMSDLLNALDGMGAGEDRLVFMTTNHPDQIDPALIRAGRIDRRFRLDYADDNELRRFHARIGAQFALLPWEEFRQGLPEKATIADAQALAFRSTL